MAVRKPPRTGWYEEVPNYRAEIETRKAVGATLDFVRRDLGLDDLWLRWFDYRHVGWGPPDALVDDPGNIWVLEYNRPGDGQPRWTVFDPDGRLLGTLEFPIGFTPHHIGEDFVLGECTPSCTRAAAALRFSGVMRLSAPSWSSSPQRPQLESELIHFCTSSAVVCGAS